MEILYNADDRKVDRLSSIDQHKNKFAVYAQGGWLPISYDVLETIGCNGAKWHQAIMTDDPSDNGYTYPEAYCTKYTNKYVYTDEQGTEIKELPEWYGASLYESFYNNHAITNADNGALGVVNKIRYRIGLDYYRAKETLQATK